MVRGAVDEETHDIQAWLFVASDFGKTCQKQRNKKENQKWKIEKPKPHNARRTRGIYFVDPAEAEFKEQITMHGESWKFRCQQQCFARSGEESTRKFVADSDVRKTKCVFVVEADELRRKRWQGTLHKDHEDHIAGRGINSLNHYNLVHKIILMFEAINIPDAKAALDKEWENSRKYQHGSWRKSGMGERLSMEQARKTKIVRFASLSGICHLKNSELEPTFQKIQRPSCSPRGHFVKYDSVSCVAFTEQGSVASQMSFAKSNGCHCNATGMRRTSSKLSISLHQVQMEDAQSLFKTF